MSELANKKHQPAVFPESGGDERSIKIISCIFRKERLEAVLKAICSRYPVSGITLMEVQGFDPRSTTTDQYRGVTFVVTIKPRVCLQVAVPAAQVNDVVGAIREAARTGRNGDGKIFITDVSDVVRVRTGEKGVAAI